MSADFSSQDLRGRSFAGQDLAGAVFRGADLRGTDFRDADLRGADFRSVGTGMRPAWSAALFGVALVFSIALGVAAAFVGSTLRAQIASPAPEVRTLGVLIAAELSVYLIAAVWRGIHTATTVVLPVVAAVTVVGGLIAIATGTGTGQGALSALVFLIAAGAIIILGSLARVAAGTMGGVLFVVVAVSGGLAGGLFEGGIPAAAIAIGSAIAGRRTLKSPAQAPRMARAALAAASAGGTRFRRADLRGATFAEARLEVCDFRGARLEEADLDVQVKKLCLFDGEPFADQKPKRK